MARANDEAKFGGVGGRCPFVDRLRHGGCAIRYCGARRRPHRRYWARGTRTSPGRHRASSAMTRPRSISAALALESSPYLRGAKITVSSSMDGVAIRIEGRHGKQSIYLDRMQASKLCFQLHGAVIENLRANANGGAL